MDMYKKRPDPVDTAYREAVGRLKILLAESYTVPITSKRHFRDDSGDDTDNQSLLSSRSRHSHHHYHRTSPFISRRYPFYSTLHNIPSGKYDKNHGHGHEYNKNQDGDRKDNAPEKYDEPPRPEMVSFIQRQEDYIEQLEREAQFCRDELSGLLGKVKEVISENENLHEKQKSNLIKSVFNQIETETETETEMETKSSKKSPRKSRRLEGPSIVFESRISELEAQLTQTKIELRKCLEENENYKRKIADGTLGDLGGFDSYKIQVDNLQRDKNNLQDQVTKLQYELAQLKERNNDTSHKIKRSLDVVEQAQFEKTQLESEIRRLKDELDRQHDKLRESIHDQGRRIADERAAVERRYTQQIEQLTAELGIQWETTSKLQLELDKQRREDTDVKREVAQKQAHIDELRKEMQSKTAILQSDLASSSAEKGALEQQIASLHLAVERAERQGKQEANRLQAEVQSLRQRLDRADADLLHSRRENLRLSEQVASLEKELNMNALLSEDKSVKPSTSAGVISAEPLPLPPPSKDREKELTSMIQNMESKHVATVAELEGMIHSQNQLMEKLTSECHLLTQKLEDSSNRHKEEIRELQTNLDYLSNKFNKQQAIVDSSSYKDDQHYVDNPQRTAPNYAGSSTPTPQRISPTNDRTQSSPIAQQSPINTQQIPRSRTESNASLKGPQTIKRKPSIVDHQPIINQEQIYQKLQKKGSKEKFSPQHTQPIKKQSSKERISPQLSQDFTQKRNSKDLSPQHHQEQEYQQPEQPEESYPQQSEYDPSYTQDYDQMQYQQQQYDPNSQQYDPNTQYDPSTQEYDPSTQQYDPNTQQYDPNTQQYDPNSQQYDPNTQQYDPNVEYQGEPQTDPQYPQEYQSEINQQYTDPNYQEQYQTEQDYLMDQEYPQEYPQKYPQEYPQEYEEQKPEPVSQKSPQIDAKK